MNNEFQILVYGVEGDILSSQHYDYEPTENEVVKLISEDNGVSAEVYEVNGDDYSKHLLTYKL